MRTTSRCACTRLSLSLVAVAVLACDGAKTIGPSCLSPAPLLGQRDARAPGYIVVYHDGVQPQQETTHLAAKYNFAPRFVYEHAPLGFSAALTVGALAGVRCEASVR